MNTSINFNEQKLSEIITKRALKRGLSVDINRMSYAFDSLFASLGERSFNNALFVGIGHGHDALFMLLQDKARTIIGVDPYIETDGNGQDDYNALIEASKTLSLSHRIQVYQGTIQEYLIQNTKDKFDLVIISDVLHHIFVTTDPLSQSNLYLEACELFASLRRNSTEDAVLAIADVERHGLRPLLHTYGPLKRQVEYNTKQSAKEWNKAITAGGWTLFNSKNYVPYAMRKAKFLEKGLIARKTLLERYYLYYSPSKITDK